MTAPDLVFEFKKLQEDRVRVYGLFERAFQHLMSDQGETGLEEYQRSCNAVTARFAEHSSRIRAVESCLINTHKDAPAAARIARSIRTIQELEREKLQVTAALQIARQRSAAANSLRETSDEELPEVEFHSTRLREEVAELTEKLSVVEGINDAMQEISDDLAELLEDQ